MAIYSSKLVGNSFDVLIDEANRARETYGAGVEKFQNMIMVSPCPSFEMVTQKIT